MRLLCLLLCGFPEFTRPLHSLSSTCGWTLTVWVFIRQPVVLVAMQLIVRVPGMALVLSRVAVDILALFPVAHLELISRSHTGAASVGWSEKVAEQKLEALFRTCRVFISPDSFWSMLRGEIGLWGPVTINFLGLRECIVLQKKQKKRKTVSYLGLSQSRVRNLTPPPQVREHCPNSLHEPQFPSCFIMSGVSQMQWPLKQCCDRQKTQDRFSICLILAQSKLDLCIMHQLVSESRMPAA